MSQYPSLNRRAFGLGLAAALAGCGPARAGDAWQAYADPAHAGFSPERLDEARAHADASRSAAVMILRHGKVVAAWGAVDRPLMVASVRKSLAGALYGIAIGRGKLRLDATLADIGLNDAPPLNEAELKATFGDLTTSRSGVYHQAAYAGSDQDAERPARGSHPPGTHFFYNNWDFNAAERAYELTTGEDLYEAFARRVARPLGMQDFDPNRQLRVLEPGLSHLEAHTFRMSARDVARFGQLYLAGGRWEGRQVVPRAWVEDSLSMHSALGDGSGYGRLWWIYEPGGLGANYPVLNRMPIRMARGTGGQTIFLLPAEDMVVVHLGDTDNARPVRGPAIWQLVESLAAARVAPTVAKPRLAGMQVEALASNLPAPAAPAIVRLSEAELARLVGDYVMGNGALVRIFLHQGRLFANAEGQGEAELFATGPLDFVILVEAGMRLRFEASPDGAITRSVLTMQGQEISATRR